MCIRDSSGTIYSTKYLTIQARAREAFRQTATVCTQRCASYCFLTASRQPIVYSTAAISMTTNDTLAPSGVATPSNPAPWRRSLTSPPHRHGPTSASRDPAPDRGPLTSRWMLREGSPRSSSHACRHPSSTLWSEQRDQRHLGSLASNGERPARNGYAARNAAMGHAP